MRLIWRSLLVLAIVFAGVQPPPFGGGPARAQPSAAPSAEEASGLRVIAVRELTQRAGIELVFGESSAETLQKFSSRAVGRDVDFLIDGRKIATLKLRDAIVGNSVVLTGHFSEDVKKSLRDMTASGGVTIRVHRQ
jgi:preprotein translocase subunit SecD